MIECTKKVDVAKLTLKAFAALQGYEEQRELLEEIHKTEAGSSLKQPDLSLMMRGGQAWPKARLAVGLVLFRGTEFPAIAALEDPDEQRSLLVATLIENAAARRKEGKTE